MSPTSDEGPRNTLLRSLTEVGPTKPVGYLPLDAIRDFTNLTPEAIASEAKTRGLGVAIFDPDNCCIKSGAIYLYDTKALARLLQAQANAVAAAELPHEPDRFVAHIASVWYAEDSPACRIIAAAFGDAD